MSESLPIVEEPAVTQPAAPEPAAAQEVAPAARKEPREAPAGFMGTLQSLAVTVVIAVFVITFLVQAFQIPSESMEKTLLIGDYLLVDKVVYGNDGMFQKLLPYREVRRGDIVVFRYPVHPAQHFVKRVVGIPGDRIRLDGQQLRVNGRLLDEDYAVYRQGGVLGERFPAVQSPAVPHMDAQWWDEMPGLVDGGELVVPDARYFVLGDNRDDSYDSRYWGFVPRENIIGRPLLIYWSIGGPDRAAAASLGGDRLSYFVYRVTHLLDDTRWERTLRRVR